MNHSDREAKNSRSPRNRHNGRINAFKGMIMTQGTGFQTSDGTHYAEAVVGNRKMFNSAGQLMTVPMKTRVVVQKAQ